MGSIRVFPDQEEPARLLGARGKPQPASRSTFQLALSLEWEEEKDTVGAGCWIGTERCRASSIPSPGWCVVCSLSPFRRWSALIHPGGGSTGPLLPLETISKRVVLLESTLQHPKANGSPLSRE